MSIDSIIKLDAILLVDTHWVQLLLFSVVYPIILKSIYWFGPVENSRKWEQQSIETLIQYHIMAPDNGHDSWHDNHLLLSDPMLCDVCVCVCVE